MKYRKGDYIEYMTNQPEIHALEIVGEVDIDHMEIEQERHVGRILSVIDNGASYLIVSLDPSEGFRSVENADKVVRLLDDDEITEEMRCIQSDPTLTAPNVYNNNGCQEGDFKEKCEKIALAAMTALFPDDVVEYVKMDNHSDYIKEDMIKCLDDIQNDICNKENREALSGLELLKNEISAEIRKMRFKEYYSVQVGITCSDEDPFMEEEGFTLIHSMKFYRVAIDLNFEEVSVMRDILERSAFHNSLGPEADYASNLVAKFRKNIY